MGHAFVFPRRYWSGSNVVASKINFATFCGSFTPTIACVARIWYLFVHNVGAFGWLIVFFFLKKIGDEEFCICMTKRETWMDGWNVYLKKWNGIFHSKNRTKNEMDREKKNTKQFEWFIQKKRNKKQNFQRKWWSTKIGIKTYQELHENCLKEFFLFGSWKFDWIHARDNNNKINSVLIDWDTLKRRMQWFGGAEYGECITNVHLARQKYIKVKGWTDRKRKSRQTKQTERERGEKNLLQNCIIARLSMTNTIKVWIQSNRIETFLCGFLLIFFVRHYSRCNDHITTILKINMCVRARVCSFVFVRCEFLWQF